MAPEELTPDPEFIYVVRCECDKWYIGRTNNVERRFLEHASGNGSGWTHLYPAIELVEKLPYAPFLEDAKTLEYIQRYGIYNVRGGSYCQVTLPDAQLVEIERKLRGENGKCFNCGGDHYIQKCPTKVEDDFELIPEDIEEPRSSFWDIFSFFRRNDPPKARSAAPKSVPAPPPRSLPPAPIPKPASAPRSLPPLPPPPKKKCWRCDMITSHTPETCMNPIRKDAGFKVTKTICRRCSKWGHQNYHAAYNCRVPPP